jgi:hypothetical protein
VKNPSKKGIDSSQIYKLCDKAELTAYNAKKMDLWDAWKSEVKSLMDEAWAKVDRRDKNAIAYVQGITQKLGIVLEGKDK